MALSSGSKKALGTRHHCKKCKTAFYDLGKSIPRCPVCDVIPQKGSSQSSNKNEAKSKSLGQIAFVNVTLGIVETVIPRSFDANNFKAKGDGWHVVATKKQKDQKSIYIDRPPLLGLKKFISGFFFKGIGDAAASEIVEAFGMKLLDILYEQSYKTLEKGSLSNKQIEILKNGWSRAKSEALFEILFSELGLTGSQQKFLKENFGDDFVPQVISEPFELLQQVPRLQFSEMEPILKRLNIPVTEEQIILASAHFRLVQSQQRFGNTCAPLEALIKGVAEITDFEPRQIRETISSRDKLFHFFEQEKKQFIQTQASQNRDNAIITEIKRIASRFSRKGETKSFVRSELKTVAGVELSDEQVEAINNSVNKPINVITGGPGAGKTTMVLGLVSALEALDLKVKLCAPTGRAAKRIAETPALKKFSPSTIHRYLVSPEGQGKKDYDVMIVDESSMIDINLLLLLLETIPDGASVLFIGDADQLPPVGPGQPFKDMIASGAVSLNRLTGNFRQSSFSEIVKATRAVIKGEMPELYESLETVDFAFIEAEPENVADIILNHLFDKMPKTMLGATYEDIQLLSPMHSRSAGISNLNQLVQRRVSRKGQPIYSRKSKDGELEFYPTDRVIMKSNNYDLGVMNGDIGFILRKSGKGIICDFDNKEVEFGLEQIKDLDLAYAISIHKSQGSEYPGVIIPVTREHSFMLSRNLLYTAITRGKQQVLMVGQSGSLRAALGRVMTDNRYTNLRHVMPKI